MASSDFHSLKRTLNDRVVDVCQRLMPDGKVSGPEFVYDPGAGKIKVAIRGAKLGIWSWFGGDDVGGDLIDLWCHVRKLTVVQALDEIRAYLGVEQPKFFTHPSVKKKEWTRPARPPNCHAPRERARDYLVDDRNIPEEILTRYKIAEKDGRIIIFPFMRDGELVMVKQRVAEDGARPAPPKDYSNMEPCLFGWQAVGDNDRNILITEGEIDALSMAAYEVGIPALSVPYGGGGGAKQQWIENDFDRLQRFETIYLALDSDDEGRKATAEIARRLGLHRCRIVLLPHKDANECLVNGVPRETILKCIADAETMDPEGLKKPSDFLEDVIDLFYPPSGKPEGYSFPFLHIADKVHARPGEVSVWTGALGSGKSMLLSYCAVDWVRQGSRICIASLEMKPKWQMHRMIKQASNTALPTVPMIRAAAYWLDGGVRLYDFVGQMTLDRILEVFDYARARYGCNQFIIDSLMKLGVAPDDYNGQNDIINRVVTWAAQHNVHVHFVAHARKGASGDKAPQTADDIKGGQEIGANAFNIFIVWRNRQREEAMQNGAPKDTKLLEIYKKAEESPSVIFKCWKQRNGPWEKSLGLWFNEDTFQYRGSLDSKVGVEFVEMPSQATNAA